MLLNTSHLWVAGSNTSMTHLLNQYHIMLSNNTVCILRISGVSVILIMIIINIYKVLHLHNHSKNTVQRNITRVAKMIRGLEAYFKK